MKTDNELKQLLAKMLPDEIEWNVDYTTKRGDLWLKNTAFRIKDSELLHICWLISATLEVNDMCRYNDELDAVCVPVHICPNTHIFSLTEASWQQRASALAKVKGLMC